MTTLMSPKVCTARADRVLVRTAGGVLADLVTQRSPSDTTPAATGPDLPADDLTAPTDIVEPTGMAVPTDIVDPAALPAPDAGVADALANPYGWCC